MPQEHYFIDHKPILLSSPGISPGHCHRTVALGLLRRKTRRRRHVFEFRLEPALSARQPIAERVLFAARQSRLLFPALILAKTPASGDRRRACAARGSLRLAPNQSPHTFIKNDYHVCEENAI
jgi:hypothetical protein